MIEAGAAIAVFVLGGSVILGLLALALWIWMLVTCLTREQGTQQIAWLLALIFLPVVGTLLFLCLRYTVHRQRHESGNPL